MTTDNDLFDNALSEARQKIARRANELSSTSRRRGGAPVLSKNSARDVLISWLQWADPNGSHTDELAAVDGSEPYDLDGAWDALEVMLDSSG